MTLVVLSGVLSLHPLIEASTRRFYQKTAGKKMPSWMLALALFFLLLSVWFVGFYVYSTPEFLNSWIARPGTWWKMLLGGLLLLGCAWLPPIQLEWRWIVFGVIPFIALIIATDLTIKAKGFGIAVGYFYAFAYIAWLSSYHISIWLSRQVVKFLGDERGPLTVSVLCLSIAAAIQLFVLP